MRSVHAPVDRLFFASTELCKGIYFEKDAIGEAERANEHARTRNELPRPSPTCDCAKLHPRDSRCVRDTVVYASSSLRRATASRLLRKGRASCTRGRNALRTLGQQDTVASLRYQCFSKRLFDEGDFSRNESNELEFSMLVYTSSFPWKWRLMYIEFNYRHNFRYIHTHTQINICIKAIS